MGVGGGGARDVQLTARVCWRRGGGGGGGGQGRAADSQGVLEEGWGWGDVQLTASFSDTAC